MIDESVWEHIYNSVFCIYLPPDKLIEKIIIKDSNEKKEFKNSSELITYMTLNMDKEIIQKDIKFILKNNKLYNENQNIINDIYHKLK